AAPPQQAGGEGATAPTANHLPDILPGNIVQITVHPVRAAAFEDLSNGRDNIMGRQHIVGVDKADNIPGGRTNALVEGVVDTLVRLTDDLSHPVRPGVDYVQGAVRGIAIDDNMLDVAVGLSGHRSDGICNGRSAVEGGGDN